MSRTKSVWRDGRSVLAVWVMDKVGVEGCGQEDQIGARFGASMWIFPKPWFAMVKDMENSMMSKMDSITDAVYEGHE